MRGDAVAIIDADLQDPPELILDMIKYYEEGYDADNKKETKNDYYSKFIKEECLVCSNFLFCNSCRVYIREAKDNDDIENYCKGMKAIIKKFKNLISNKELYNQNE